MDPTERLYCLLSISRECKNTDALLEDIEQTIKDGAVLNEKYYSSVLHFDCNIPILHAIQFKLHIKIIELLKRHWWEDSSDFRMVHLCDECDKYDRDGWLNVKGNMSVYLHNDFFNNCDENDDYDYNYYMDLFKIFDVNFISDSYLRHKFINKYIIR